MDSSDLEVDDVTLSDRQFPLYQRPIDTKAHDAWCCDALVRSKEV
jgi:hypothetical protein